MYFLNVRFEVECCTLFLAVPAELYHDLLFVLLLEKGEDMVDIFRRGDIAADCMDDITGTDSGLCRW